MRLPDGRNVATRQAVRCKLLTHWAFEYFDQTTSNPKRPGARILSSFVFWTRREHNPLSLGQPLPGSHAPPADVGGRSAAARV